MLLPKTEMGKHKRPTPPKKRSPVPPPERIIGETSYRREDDRQRLRNAVRRFEQDRPSCPIKLVVLDLDSAVWAVETGSCDRLHPPLGKVDASTVADASGTRVTLARGARHVLATLRSRHILVSVVNRTNPENARELLELFGLAEFVACWAIAPQPTRLLVQAIRREIGTEHGLRLAAGAILLVDDAKSSIADVQPLEIRTVRIGREIRELADLPHFLSKIA